MVLHQAGYSFYHSVVQYHICSNNTKQIEYIWYYTRLGIVSITVQYSTIYALITQNNQNIYGTTLGWVQFVVWYHICSNNTKQLEYIWYYTRLSTVSITVQYSTIYALITHNLTKWLIANHTFSFFNHFCFNERSNFS